MWPAMSGGSAESRVRLSAYELYGMQSTLHASVDRLARNDSNSKSCLFISELPIKPPNKIEAMYDSEKAL